ncbi:MAG: hypothetical protein HY228_02605 [Candidatus Yonathbacteria bacterium]|nr:hypothetical protein [Candidatus Yonathbacteria bacterium]
MNNMEEEAFKTIQKQEKGDGLSTVSFPGISFAPPDAGESMTFSSFDVREKCAFVGVVLGCISIISWTIIVLGIVVSLIGIIFSIFGIKSPRSKIARTGLILSLAGGAATILYIVLISAGIINYNYFTNEFWGIPSGGVQVIE